MKTSKRLAIGTAVVVGISVVFTAALLGGGFAEGGALARGVLALGWARLSGVAGSGGAFGDKPVPRWGRDDGGEQANRGGWPCEVHAEDQGHVGLVDVPAGWLGDFGRG